MRGCFTWEEYEFVFEGRVPGYMTLRAPSRKFECRADIRTDHLEMLDRFIAYWRESQGRRGAMGTTDFEARVTWHLGGEPAAMEEFPHAFPPRGLMDKWAMLLLGRPRGLVAGGPKNAGERRTLVLARRASFLEESFRAFPLKDIHFADESTVSATLMPDAACDDFEVRRISRVLARSCPLLENQATITCRLYSGDRIVAEYTPQYERSG
jgi:hypothetical protein